MMENVKPYSQRRPDRGATPPQQCTEGVVQGRKDAERARYSDDAAPCQRRSADYGRDGADAVAPTRFTAG
jgi:hypothetical protein